MRGPQVLRAIVTLFGYSPLMRFEPTTQDIKHRDNVPIWPRPALGDLIGVGQGAIRVLQDWSPRPFSWMRIF